MSEINQTRKESVQLSKPESSFDQLASIADEITDRIQRDEPVNIDEFVTQHPELEHEIRDTYASLKRVFEMRRSLVHSKSEMDVVRPVNNKIGEYRIIHELGRGGMGIVYEAEQASLSRRVALKVLPFAALLDSKRLDRFRNEARAAAQLKHPNIVSIYAVGCEQGIHFFSMELIEGQSLASIVSHAGVAGPTRHNEGMTAAKSSEDGDTVPIAQLSTEFSTDRRSYFRSVARLGIQAAEALHFAHREGVIHRDIKPSNLLLNRDGVLHIADFGLARLETGSDLTATGDVVGTLRYMSPEQLESGALVDQRTDIYSLGLTLYELISRKPAFDAEQKQHLIRQVVEDELPQLNSVVTNVPTDLANVIHKASAKNRNDRYETAQEFADDLQRFLAHKPVQARRVSQLEHLRRWTRRNPLVAVLLAILFLTLLSSAIAGVAGSLHLAKVANDTKLRLYASDVRRAQDLLEEGDTLQAIKVLEQYIPKGQTETDHRHFEWYYLRSLCDELSPKWTFGHSISARDAVFSPDGKILATCAYSRNIDFWDVMTGKKIRSTVEWSKNHRRVLFTNDGTTVITCSWDGSIKFWDVATGKLDEEGSIWGDGKSYACDLALSTDGGLLAAYWLQKKVGNSEVSASVRVWDLATRQEIIELPNVTAEPSGIHFSPDNKSLIAGNDQGQILVWNCERWGEPQAIDSHLNGITSVCWSPNGKYVATSSYRIHGGFVRGEIKIWDPSTWENPMTIQHHDERIHEIDFSPDSKWILVASADSRVSIWNTNDGSCVRSFRAHAARVSSARMSPDGTLLATASADNVVKLWNVADLTKTSSATSVYRDAQNFIHSLVISPDGRWVVTGDISGQVIVRSISTGDIRWQCSVVPPTRWQFEVAASPDSQWLAIASGRRPPDAEPGGEISIYNLTTGQRENEFPTPEPYWHGLEFSPNGKWLAVGSEETVRMFDWQTGEIETTLTGFGYIKMLRWSPKQNQFAVAELNGTTSVYSVPGFRRIKQIRTDEDWGTITVNYSPEGDVFATAGGCRVVKIWDAESFELLQVFDECPDWIGHLHFSHDGKRVLTTSKDGLLRVWHRELGSSLLTLYVSHKWPMNGRFSPDGKTIAAGADVLRIWRAKDRFKPSPVYTPPPNLPCVQAIELGPSKEK